MKPNLPTFHRVVMLFLLNFCLAAGALADQMELVNGDRYSGRVIAVTDTQVKFQSDVQGQIVLPRDKVSTITFGKKEAAVPRAAVPQVSVTNVLEQARVQGIEPGLLEKVRNQYLGEGGPEANELFNQTVSGLMSGKISIGTIRSQARSVLAELNDLKQDFDDPELNEVLRQYGSILETFIKQADIETTGIKTNTPSRTANPKPR